MIDTLNDVKHILIAIAGDDGEFYQVLASNENKRIALIDIYHLEGCLNVSKEVQPEADQTDTDSIRA